MTNCAAPRSITGGPAMRAGSCAACSLSGAGSHYICKTYEARFPAREAGRVRQGGRWRSAGRRGGAGRSERPWPPCWRGLAQGQPRPSLAGKPAQPNHSSPVCVRPVERPPRPCARPARACIVLPRAAPRNAAARTPRTGYCGRRRRSDRPFRTGLQRWLEKELVLSQAPVFHEFLESIYFFNF